MWKIYSLDSEEFPGYWKKANAESVHKKESKNLLKNYRPRSLFPISGKTSERVIFKDLFNYFHKNKLFTKFQSGFLPDDSCISQLSSIAHDINSSVDCVPMQDVMGIYLDISKAFDKVWRKGFLFKLKTYAVKKEFKSFFKSAFKESLLMVRSLLGSW